MRHPSLRLAAAGVLLAAAGAPLVWPNRVDGGLRRAVYSAVAPQVAYPTYQAVDLVANVVLFIPVGLGLTLLLGRWWAGLAGGTLLSVAAETVQLFLPHRVASLVDVATNAAGVAIGVVLAQLLVVAARSARFVRVALLTRRRPAAALPAEALAATDAELDEQSAASR